MSQNEHVRPDSGIDNNSRPTSSLCEKEGAIKYVAQPADNPINFNADPTGDEERRTLMPGDCVELVSLRVDIDALRSRCRAELGDANGPNEYPLWLLFAFDLSTYSILAADFDIFRPDAHAWRCVLAMCGTDKERAADVVGAQRNWKIAAMPRVIVTDDGSVFRSAAFHDALVLLGANHLVRPGGKLRSAKAIDSMIGRIVSSIVRADDLSHWINPAIMPMEYAIGTALVRAVIDHYQAEPMQAMSGECPDMAWYEACKLHGTPRVFTEHEVQKLLDVTSFEDRPTES